jgi:hypothetical protein
MCSEIKVALTLLLILMVSCTSYRKVQKIRSGEVVMELAVADEKPLEEEEGPVIDSIRSTLSDGPLIMNAIRDDATGEMVATDIINASRVVARFRNVAERAGYVSVGFDVIVVLLYDGKDRNILGILHREWDVDYIRPCRCQSDVRLTEVIHNPHPDVYRLTL